MRTISQIYSEAVNTRNNYLQLTELNSGRSNSKLSIINLLTYVMAVCIHTYETIIDLFQVRLSQVLNGRINGTPDWYVRMAKLFQYNSVTEAGDEMIFNEDTLKIEYVNTNTSKRIVEQAAYQTNDKEDALTLKVCKANDSTAEINSGIPYLPLTNQELTAFKHYIERIKFVGANVNSESLPGDILKIVADTDNPIFYNDSYVTASQALLAIQKSLIDFVNSREFNGLLYYQAVLDVIRKTDNIVDVSNNIKIYISSYDATSKEYMEPKELKNRMRLKSGYIRLLDENSVSTVNSENLTLIGSSLMDQYLLQLT